MAGNPRQQTESPLVPILPAGQGGLAAPSTPSAWVRFENRGMGPPGVTDIEPVLECPALRTPYLRCRRLNSVALVRLNSFASEVLFSEEPGGFFILL